MQGINDWVLSPQSLFCVVPHVFSPTQALTLRVAWG